MVPTKPCMGQQVARSQLGRGGHRVMAEVEPLAISSGCSNNAARKRLSDPALSPHKNGFTSEMHKAVKYVILELHQESQ